jgi:hypothetical protein
VLEFLATGFAVMRPGKSPAEADVMDQGDSAKISYEQTIDVLARAIERHTFSAGDHVTAFPALSLHRRDAPTEPVHCIYDFGLAITTQGAKQVMLGDKVFNYGPAGPC